MLFERRQRRSAFLTDAGERFGRAVRGGWANRQTAQALRQQSRPQSLGALLRTPHPS